MVAKSHIEKLAKQAIQETDLFIVDIHVGTDNRIMVHIDSFDGVKIDDCVRVSRHIEHSLDREQEDFELHVSSAGLDQPFKIWEQYKKNVGRDVKMVLNDGETFIGKLQSATEGKCSLVVADFLREIPYNEIKQTKIVISFK